MRPRQLIIETLLKEATDEEKLAADLLDGVFDEIASDIKADKDALTAPQQNEGVVLASVGGVVAGPALMKIIGKGVKLGQNALRKRKGEEPVDSNAIIEMAEKLHNMLIGAIEKALFFIKDKDKKHRLAVIIFHAVVAGLLVASGKGFFKALAKHQDSAAFIEAMLTAIKTGELGVFASETFGALAAALGTTTELSDAIDLTDMEGIDEMSASGAGSVAGYSLPLGAKPKKDLEENQMNKLKITKGRLRKIIAEEVSRHKKMTEGMDPKLGDTEEMAAGFSAQAKGAAATKGGPEEADPFYEAPLDKYDAQMKNIARWSEEGRDIPHDRTAAKMRDAATEDWDEHFSGAVADDTAHIDALERDRHEDKESEDEWHSDEHETLGDRKYADRLREQVQQALEEMLSDEPLEEKGSRFSGWGRDLKKNMVQMEVSPQDLLEDLKRTVLYNLQQAKNHWEVGEYEDASVFIGDLDLVHEIIHKYDLDDPEQQESVMMTKKDHEFMLKMAYSD